MWDNDHRDATPIQNGARITNTNTLVKELCELLRSGEVTERGGGKRAQLVARIALTIAHDLCVDDLIPVFNFHELQKRVKCKVNAADRSREEKEKEKAKAKEKENEKDGDVNVGREAEMRNTGDLTKEKSTDLSTWIEEESEEEKEEKEEEEDDEVDGGDEPEEQRTKKESKESRRILKPSQFTFTTTGVTLGQASFVLHT